MAEIKVQRESRSGSWLWVLLALIAVAAILIYANSGEDRTANAPGGGQRSTSGAQAPSGTAPGNAPGGAAGQPGTAPAANR